MDDRVFDALARAIERRGLLRAVLLAAGLGGFAALAPDAQGGNGQGFCAKKPTGARCRKRKQCCSGRCKKKKRKRKGKCRCSQLQARCSSDNDCCPPAIVNAILPECGLRDMAPERRCCMESMGHCREDADCCGNAECVDVEGELLCVN